eukprot:762820-Hanusia_phi.AAC.8
MSGLFVITFSGFIFAFFQAIFERYMYAQKLKKEQGLMEQENAEMDPIEECEVEPSEASEAPSQASENGDVTEDKTHHEDQNLDYGEMNEYLEDVSTRSRSNESCDFGV